MKETNTMQAKFTHDCDNCQFLGHFHNHDVYICHGQSALGSSIIARHGNDGPEYASSPIKLFRQQIEENTIIAGTNEDKTNWEMPFNDYLFSDKVIPYHKAWLLALTLIG